MSQTDHAGGHSRCPLSHTGVQDDFLLGGKLLVQLGKTQPVTCSLPTPDPPPCPISPHGDPGTGRAGQGLAAAASSPVRGQRAPGSVSV